MSRNLAKSWQPYRRQEETAAPLTRAQLAEETAAASQASEPGDGNKHTRDRRAERKRQRDRHQSPTVIGQ